MVPREEDDARRDLRRLDEQSEKLLGTRSTDIGPDDPIERLGKRIARVLVDPPLPRPRLLSLANLFGGVNGA